MALIPEMLTHGEIWDQDKIISETTPVTYDVKEIPIYTAASTTILKSIIFKAVSYKRVLSGPYPPSVNFFVHSYEEPIPKENPTLILYIKPNVTTVIDKKIVIDRTQLTSFEKTIILNPHDKLILDVKNLDTAKDKITAVHYAIFGAKKI